MDDQLPIQGGPGPIPGLDPATRKPESSPESGPAFRALLDKLEHGAQGLTRASEVLDKPEQLAGAVDRARATLDDALSLGDQLLEAFRAANQAGTDAEGTQEP
jgi:hypothetical protein